MKINELERAKLAIKHDLRIQCWMDEEWGECMSTTFHDTYPHRVHPDDSDKLDAIIWKGVHSRLVAAYHGNYEGVIYRENTNQHVDSLKLIATRELPAEEWDESRIDVIAQNGYEGLHYNMLPPEKEKLFADLKGFVSEVYGYFVAENLEDKHKLKSLAEPLLERINPKPVRNSADLPVNTLCEVWGSPESLDMAYSDGNGGFFSNGLTSITGASTACLDGMNFKVLEQPKPTAWFGGECPVPDWVEVKVWYRDSTYGTDQSRSNNSGWLHNGLAKHAEIIAYQIMGEKE